uniref:Inhibin alpha chain n=1 Tax=Pogona vitticeps TaxID=103695 RepID=A0A6J0TH13_9SAUR
MPSFPSLAQQRRQEGAGWVKTHRRTTGQSDHFTQTQDNFRIHTPVLGHRHSASALGHISKKSHNPVGVLRTPYILPLHLLDQSPLPTLPPINPMLMLLLALLLPAAVAGCSREEVDRPLILAKIKAHFLETLGPVPQSGRSQVGQRKGLHRRHASGTPAAGRWAEEDTSQVIVFPSTDVPCGPPEPDELPEEEGLFTYIFKPSAHTLSRVITSAQLWFYTGPVTMESSSPSEAASNSSRPKAEVLKLSEQGRIPVATTAVPAQEGWTVFHFGASFFPYIAQIFVLFIHCPGCPCVANAEKIPFLVISTKSKVRDRARRSSLPLLRGDPSFLQLLSSDATVHANCHRASINISFEELGWDKWIVHPSSFLFHYCHGSCPDTTFTHRPNFQLCCAALPGTMHPLRVRTTSDGGFSFKYETVPNIITQDCACI